MGNSNTRELRKQAKQIDKDPDSAVFEVQNGRLQIYSQQFNNWDFLAEVQCAGAAAYKVKTLYNEQGKGKMALYQLVRTADGSPVAFFRPMEQRQQWTTRDDTGVWEVFGPGGQETEPILYARRHKSLAKESVAFSGTAKAAANSHGPHELAVVLGGGLEPEGFVVDGKGRAVAFAHARYGHNCPSRLSVSRAFAAERALLCFVVYDAIRSVGDLQDQAYYLGGRGGGI